jgi:hypothetical protein
LKIIPNGSNEYGISWITIMKNKLFKTCLTGLALSVAGLANAGSVPLGSASPFTVLSASGTVNCTNSTIEGDVGSAVAGTQTRCMQTGEVIAPVSSDIQADFSTAYSALADEQCGNYLTTLAGQTIAPGTYCVDQASTNTGGVLTLDGNVDDTWLFKIGSSGAGALTGTDFVVEMSGDADACNVTWWVADAVTLTRGDFKGDILAGKAVTVTGVASNSPLKGRVMANGNVVLSNADALGCVAEAAARTEEGIAAVLAAKLAAEEAAAVALLAVVNEALAAVIGVDNEYIIGADGKDGKDGKDGADGSACTVSQGNGNATIQCGVGGTATIWDGGGSSSVSGKAPGDMQYWDGNEWTMVSAPIENADSLSFCDGQPTWTQGGCPLPDAICPLWSAADLDNVASISYNSVVSLDQDGMMYVMGENNKGIAVSFYIANGSALPLAYTDRIQTEPWDYFYLDSNGLADGEWTTAAADACRASLVGAFVD